MKPPQKKVFWRQSVIGHHLAAFLFLVSAEILEHSGVQNEAYINPKGNHSDLPFRNISGSFLWLIVFCITIIMQLLPQLEVNIPFTS